MWNTETQISLHADSTLFKPAEFNETKQTLSNHYIV